MSYLTKTRIYQGKQNGNGGGGGGGGSNAFDGNRPITRDIPEIDGINAGTVTIQDWLNAIFFPTIAPTAQLTIENATREVGDSLDYTLDWTATKTSNAITGITVDGDAETPTGNTQSGSVTHTAASNAEGSYTANMSVTDGTLSGTTSALLQYIPRSFWGTSTKDGINAPITDADILGLANSALQTSRNLTLTNFGGGATYLVFAFPSEFGTPQFIVNGLNNTAFTRVRTADNFVNSFGATIVMDVWVSNNLYNSPLDSVVIQ